MRICWFQIDYVSSLVSCSFITIITYVNGFWYVPLPGPKVSFVPSSMIWIWNYYTVNIPAFLVNNRQKLNPKLDAVYEIVTDSDSKAEGVLWKTMPQI